MTSALEGSWKRGHYCRSPETANIQCFVCAGMGEGKRGHFAVTELNSVHWTEFWVTRKQKRSKSSSTLERSLTSRVSSSECEFITIVKSHFHHQISSLIISKDSRYLIIPIYSKLWTLQVSRIGPHIQLNVCDRQRYSSLLSLHAGVAQGNNSFFRSGLIAAWAAWWFDCYTVKSLKF